MKLCAASCCSGSCEISLQLWQFRTFTRRCYPPSPSSLSGAAQLCRSTRTDIQITLFISPIVSLPFSIIPQARAKITLRVARCRTARRYNVSQRRAIIAGAISNQRASRSYSNDFKIPGNTLLTALCPSAARVRANPNYRNYRASSTTSRRRNVRLAQCSCDRALLFPSRPVRLRAYPRAYI